MGCYLYVYIKLLAVLLNVYYSNAAINVTANPDYDIVTVPLLPEELNGSASESDKAILRYGFHRTEQCQEFDKAFLCIRKCIDLEYHIAYSDKKCICKCFKNRILAQYSVSTLPPTKWRLGAPTTTLPAWAIGAKVPIGQVKPLNDVELYADYASEAGEDGGGGTGDIANATPADGATEADAGVTAGGGGGDAASAAGAATPADGATPAEDGAAPAENGAAPAEDGAAPAEDGAAPAEDGAAPAEDGAAPAEDAAAPAEGGDPPAEKR